MSLNGAETSLRKRFLMLIPWVVWWILPHLITWVSLLGGTNCYLFSLLQSLVGVINRMEKIVRNFVWTGVY